MAAIKPAESKGTKLGGSKLGAEQSKRSTAMLSSVFRAGMSTRSFSQIPQITGPVIPDDRVELKGADKEEVFSRDLKIADPQAPKAPIRLRFSTNQFEEMTNEEPLIVLHERVGRIGIQTIIKVEADAEEKVKGEEEDQEGEDEAEGVLRNQFNYSDRATQTYILHYLDQGCITEAPLPKDSTGSTTPRLIALAYSDHEGKVLLPPPHSPASVTRIMERVVNQNLDPNACCDFKYFDDARDALDAKAAFTLPLWEFRSDVLANCPATQIAWNPTVPDLFAVSYSSSSSDKSGIQHGFVCTWSLKNQSTPRNVIELNSPCFCLDWCPNQPSRLACGTADGNISIYDVHSHRINCLYSTVALKCQHSAGVTVVKWQPDDASSNATLLSAGLDGRINLWTMVQNEMQLTEIASLGAGIVALDYFNESSTHFTVACDDGMVYKVLRTRTTQEPSSFLAHAPPALDIAFNRYHDSVFITSGTDWSIKVWRQGFLDKPLQLYDFAPYYPSAIAFAPHSSSAFATVTTEGALHIFDVDLDRYQPISTTEIVELNDGALTAVAFHPSWPVILVGDEKGRVHSLKLSPNIRKNTMTQKEEEERNKLRKTSSSGGQVSRGLLPDLTQQEDMEEGERGAGDEENAKEEELKKGEIEKFEKAMGVSWVTE